MSFGRIFSKASTLVEASIEGLLNRQLDEHSPEVLAKYIEDLAAAMPEQTKNKLRARLEADSYPAQIAALVAEAAEYEASALFYLSNDDTTDDWMADVPAAKQMELEEEAESLKASQTAAVQKAELLEKQFKQLQQCHEKMVKQLKALRTAKREQKSTEEALSAVTSAKKITEGVGALNMGDALKRAQDEATVSRMALQEQVGTIQDSPEALLAKSKVAARVAALRAKAAQAKA